VLLAAAALAVAGISQASARTVERAKLTAAEHAFAKSYEVLVPTLNKASAAVVHAVGNASKDTNSQVATVFGAVARRWATATGPLLALKAPPQEATVFGSMTRLARAVEADLRSLSQAGSTDNVKEATSAGTHLARDFNALGAAIKQMKKKLGLP
jgi:Flp pilus assembly protein TadB